MSFRYILRKAAEYKYRILFYKFPSPIKCFQNQNFQQITFFGSIFGLSSLCFSPLIVSVKAKSSLETASKTSDTQTLNHSINNVSPSIVLIKGNIQCTGIVINSDGLVLTSSSAISQTSSDVEVQVTENRQSFNGRVVSVDYAKGLALVKVHLGDDLKLPKGLIFGDDEEVSQGQSIFSVSSPYYLTNSVSAGCITSIIRSDSMLQKNDIIYFVSNLLASSASLGSPLCNYSGEMIGIITREESGHTLCMPIRHVVDFINQYFYMTRDLSTNQIEVDNNKMSPEKKSGWLSTFNNFFTNSSDSAKILSNVILLQFTDDLKKDFCISNSAYRKLRHGLVVLDVLSNSQLYRDGLRKGDVILEANREVVFTRSDIEREIKKKTVFLKIVRNNQYHTLKTVYINIS